MARRLGASLLAAGLVPLTAVPAAVAAPPSPTPSPSVSGSGTCISARPAVPTVQNGEGVSQAQRTLDFTSLWDLSRGTGVKVAVIDSGVAKSPAFGNRLTGGGDLVEHAKSNGLDDCDGHGTLVAGLIAAAPDGSTGFAGVAPEASLISIRQTSALFESKDPDHTVSTSKTLAQAIDDATDQGAKVINISAAHCGPAAAADSKALADAVHRAYERDVVVVAAAANLGSDECQNQNQPNRPLVTRATPADRPEALTVGAVDDTSTPAPYSLAGPWVDVAAPGNNIISTNPQLSSGREVAEAVTDQGTTPLNGTSFAAPYVSGVAALIRARFPKLTAAQVVHRITTTAQHPGGGRNIFVGYGMINPRRALTAVLPEEGSSGTTRAAPPQTTMAEIQAPHVDPTPRRIALATAIAGVIALIAGSGILAARARRRADSERLAKRPRRAPRTRRPQTRNPSA